MIDATQPALDPCSCWPSAAADSLQPCLLLSFCLVPRLALGSMQGGWVTNRYTAANGSTLQAAIQLQLIYCTGTLVEKLA